MIADGMRRRAALTLAAGAAVWPSVHCALTAAMASPLERALSASWCGAPQAEVLGHCSPCWIGAAALLFGAAALLAPSAALGWRKSGEAFSAKVGWGARIRT